MKRCHLGWLIGLTFLFLSACGNRVYQPTAAIPATGSPPQEEPSASATIPLPTATISPPTSTPVPLAALVNGEGILLSEYQAELVRYQSGLGRSDQAASQDAQVVLDDLIDQVLLAQAAAEAGFVLEDAALQDRLNQLTADSGGEAAMRTWMSSYGYSPEEFAHSLRRAAAAAWMRDQIIAAVPERAEQVHALQILLYNSDEASRIQSQVQSGAGFEELAKEYDPFMGGELGWFVRGSLLEPKVEEAAFALQPGEVSPVVETRLGFHIVKVLERDPERVLDPEVRLVLQESTLRQWLAERRSQGNIQIFLPEYSSQG